MKKKLLIYLLFFMNYSCTEQKSSDNKDEINIVEKRGIDSNYVKIYYENSNIIKETGTKIENLKYGLWKEFNKNGRLIKATYFYSDTILFNIDLSELDFKSLDFSSNKLKLSVPKIFKGIEMNSKNILFAIKKENCDSDQFCPNYTLIFQKSPNYMLKDSLNLIINNLGSNFSELKIISVEEFELGEEAYKISFIGRKNYLKLGGIMIVFKKNDLIYNLSYLGSNMVEDGFIKQKAIVDEVINSIYFY